MITLNPTLPWYLPWFDDVGTNNWFQYILNLSMDSFVDSSWSNQLNDFPMGAEITYKTIPFAGIILPLPNGLFVDNARFPTRRKTLRNTGYDNGVARTDQQIKCNFLLNKKFDAGTSQWWSDLSVTIPVEESGWAPTVNSHSCILKKVNTAGTVSTLKTLTLTSTTTSWIVRNYTFSDATPIWALSAWDVLFIEYVLTFTAPWFTNSWYYTTLSIITNGQNNLFASIP